MAGLVEGQGQGTALAGMSKLAHGRFELRAKLGAGGMGVVYRAFDHERGHEVALKLLRHGDPVSLLSFKREFRTLAHVSHPHLVTLYELLAEDRTWFFTMELVAGVDFGTYVHGPALPTKIIVDGVPVPRTVAPHAPDDGPTPITVEGPVAEASAARAGPALPTLTPLGVARLRLALRGLASGVDALHTLGHLHRDLKPSNVLVTAAGRVVVLDFGVVLALGDGGITPRIAGTPSYMAPEQASGATLDETCDWYAVGTMIYEAMAGRRPFVGADASELLAAKELGAPLVPAWRVPAGAEDLAELATALLSPSPATRPHGAEIRTRLGAQRRSTVALGARHEPRAPFVGRDTELAVLGAARARAQAGAGQVVSVRGASGVGKSTLVGHFLDEARRAGAAVVLAGRCHRGESLPYRALDGVVDALVASLGDLPPTTRPPLRALARLFPVLRDLVGPDEPPLPPDPVEIRRAAVAALRALLVRLGQDVPVVLHVDDAQWGDLDSALLLTEVLEGAGAPAVLLVLGARAEDAPAPSFLAALAQLALPATRLDVGPLPAADARALAHALSTGLDDAAAAAIASESGGHPLLVAELCASASASAGQPRERLDELLARRLEDLPAPATELLRWIAVAGLPLPRAVAREAVPRGADEQAAFALLVNARLVREVAFAGGEAYEPYHDLLRDRLLSRLDITARSALHLRLAEALERRGDADPEALADHFAAGGVREKASAYASWAARRAADALAHDRAAELTARAMALGGDVAELRPRLAAALADAGRSFEAGEQFLLLARSATGPDQRGDYLRQAAEHLSKSGHLERSLAVFDEVLRDVGLRMSSRGAGQLGSLLATRARLRLRGLGYRERADADRRELARTDVCWAVAAGLCTIDPPRGAEFQTRHLRLALDAGEPLRIARGLAAEALMLGAAGRSGARRIERCLAEARRLSLAHHDERTRALADLADAVCHYQRGALAAGLRLADSAAATLRERCAGAAWEIVLAESCAAWSLYYMGQFGELARRVPGLVAEARRKSDLLAQANLDSGLPGVYRLAQDDAAGADEAREEVLRRWPALGRTGDFLLQHYFAGINATLTRLYVGDDAGAWAVVEGWWPRYSASVLRFFRMVRLEAAWVRGLAALAGAAAGVDPGKLSAIAAKQATILAKDGEPLAAGLASTLRAALAARAGHGDDATRERLTAASCFDSAEAAAFAAAARLRLAEPAGGEAAAQAHAHLAGHGIARVERFVRLLAPT